MISYENKPMVSIIIPCFNKAEYIRDSIESVYAQDYKSIEVVCVNDASTDSSRIIIDELCHIHPDIIFIDLKQNVGVIAARNLAIKKARGKYVFPLDADDLLEPFFLEKAVSVLESDSEVGIVYGDTRIFGSGQNYMLNTPEYSRESLIYVNYICNSSMFRRDDFYKVGEYNCNMKSGHEDWDLWLSFIGSGFSARKLNLPSISYRKGIEDCRSDFVNKSNDWKNTILKNHISLYLNNDKFGDYVFNGHKYKDEYEKFRKKYKKYKKLSFVLAYLCLILLCALLLKILGD